MIARPVGRRALLIEVDAAAEAHRLAAILRGSGLVVDEIVPGARTLLLDGVDDPASLVAAVARLPPGMADAVVPSWELVELPVTYDGEDLAHVADLWEVAVEEVVRRHTSLTFTSAFCGFAPGFAYLAGLPPEWHVPRLPEPRVRVPAGSVALAGEWCGVYPVAAPGGWLLLGHTETTLWDPSRTDPALLAPGTRVRFTRA